MLQKLWKHFALRSVRKHPKMHSRDTIRDFEDSVAEGVGMILADGVTRGMY